MRSKEILLRNAQLPFIILLQFFFLLFILVSCNDANFAFPSPNPNAWCTYDVTFNEGTSPADMDKDKAALEEEIKNGSKSTVDSIICDPSISWKEVDANHWQAEVTMNCYRAADSGVVRPPSSTKPPAGRVSSGTVKQSGCGDDEIKK